MNLGKILTLKILSSLKDLIIKIQAAPFAAKCSLKVLISWCPYLVFRKPSSILLIQNDITLIFKVFLSLSFGNLVQKIRIWQLLLMDTVVSLIRKLVGLWVWKIEWRTTNSHLLMLCLFITRIERLWSN